MLFIGIILLGTIPYWSDAKETQGTKLPTTALFPQTPKNHFYISGDPFADADKIKGKIQKKETLARSLRARGISRERTRELVNAMRKEFDFRFTRAGDTYTLLLDRQRGTVLSFEYHRDFLEIYRLTPNEKGQLRSPFAEDAEGGHVITLRGTLGSSLHTSLAKQGESYAVGLYLGELFDSRFDLYQSTKEDQFRLLIEKSDIKNRYLKILAAEILYDGNSSFAFWYVDPEGYGAYVDENGFYLQKHFLKSPIKFAPIEGEQPRYSRAKKKYFAPQGTPAIVIRDGRIASVEKAEDGFSLKIVHNSGYESFYTKISQLAPGIKKGIYVNQRRVLGYLGQDRVDGMSEMGFWILRKKKLLDTIPTNNRTIPKRHRTHFEKFFAEQKQSLSAVEFLHTNKGKEILSRNIQ